MSTPNLPPLPRNDQTLSAVWLRYFEQLHLVISDLRATVADHEARIQALEP